MNNAFRLLLFFSVGVITGQSHSNAADFAVPWPQSIRCAEFSLPSAGSPVLVPVTAGSRQLMFVVDTTMAHSIINERHKSWLEPSTVPPATRSSFYKCPHLSIGEVRLPVPETIRIAKLGGYEQVLGTTLDGVLGTDVLRKIVLYIDNDSDRFGVATEEAAPFVLGKVSIDVKYDESGVPIIPVVAGDITDHFYLDMIAWHSVALGPSLMRRLTESSELRLNDTFRIVTNRRGDQEVRVDLRCSKVAIGGSLIRDLVCFGQDRNTLACGVWSRYRIALVLSQDRVVLWPGKAIDSTDHTDKDGIEIAKASWGNEVIMVQVGKVGERAGIRDRDVISRVDGVDVSGKSRDDVCRRLFLERTANTSITIRRGSDDVEVLLPK